jgi:membrane-associated phospholipid phosphatase
MVRWRTGLGLGLSLCGTILLSTSSIAAPQTQSSTTAGRDDWAGGSKAVGGSSEPEPNVRPDHPWEDRENRVGLQLLKNIAQDQKALWLGPKNVRFADADWLVPLGGAAAAMFVTDSSYSRHLSNSPSRIKNSKDLSNYGIVGMAGIAGGLWVLGHVTHDDHKIETGILAGEAAIDTLVPVYAMKYAFGRERPLQSNYRGAFFQGGDSFPSQHAATAWSIASVIAHEYPSPYTSLIAYGLASAISAARVTGKQHFSSDVLVGSAIGWLEGMYVYRKHHDPRIGGGEWETYLESQEGNEPISGSMGSPYVPLDSWIYPALERLIAQDYISDAILGMRPWTRSECARLVEEAQDRGQVASDTSPVVQSLLNRLSLEFASEEKSAGDGRNWQMRLESLYARITSITGTPLVDGNHFGQTITNDFGRPYQSGFNSVDGFSTWTTSGRWVAYLRGEYQHSPSAPPESDAARQFIFSVDNIPAVPPASPYAAQNHFQLLDAYVGLNYEDWQFSFGKQSLWWGSDAGGPMMFSDDAEPINMFRISRIHPFKLPSILGFLGPIRVEWFLGQLSGHEFVFRTDTGIVGQFGVPISRQPFVQGQKISMKPTRNFEFSVSTTTIFSGGPTPLTLHYFLKSYSLNNGSNTQQGSTSDPGDRRSGVDFSYKIPGLRNWLTFYGDAFTEDEFSPLGYPRKSAIRGGIYMPRIPGIPKLDLRAEGGTTVPPDFPDCKGCFYVNNRYPDGSYTNAGNLIGSWLGRAGQGEQVWSTYWLTSQDKIQLNFRHQKVWAQYLPDGGTLNDGGVRADFRLGRLMLSGSAQYERWNFPLLAGSPKSNMTTSLEVSFWPHSQE